MSDSELLDWMGRCGQPGLGWTYRRSTTGRGIRLHQIERTSADFFGVPVSDTPREALRKAMELWQAAEKAANLSVDRQTEDRSFGSP